MYKFIKNNNFYRYFSQFVNKFHEPDCSMCGLVKGTVSSSAYGGEWCDELSNNEQART